MDELIKRAVEFHGHLGPFLVIGIRMGLLALEKLGSRGHFDLKVIVETGTKPPVSCIIDGIQISTGCTLGKGNIRVINKQKPKTTFTKDNKSIEIELKPDIVKKIKEWFKVESNEKTAERIMKLSDKELFLVKSS